MSDPRAMTGFPDPHRAVHAVGMPATLVCHRKAVLAEDSGQVLRRLEFLEAQLAKAEDLVDHLLRHHAHALDVGHCVAFETLDASIDTRGRPRIVGRSGSALDTTGGSRRRNHSKGRNEQNCSHGSSLLVKDEIRSSPA